MGKISQNPKIGHLTPRSFTTVRRREELTDLGNSLALGLQQGVHRISLQSIP